MGSQRVTTFSSDIPYSVVVCVYIVYIVYILYSIYIVYSIYSIYSIYGKTSLNRPTTVPTLSGPFREMFGSGSWNMCMGDCLGTK